MDLTEQYKIIFDTVKFGRVIKIDGFQVQYEYRTDGELADDALAVASAGFEMVAVDKKLVVYLNK